MTQPAPEGGFNMINLEDTAKRLDKVARERDPYDYEDNGGCLEEATNSLTLDPIGVIEFLLNIIEED